MRGTTIPKVSVITPAYNAERFIGLAVNSMLAQTFQDWEMIIVDDGSTDTTSQILAGYSDPRIRVFRQANGGEATARNTGLDWAAGEYIAFLDADDLYQSNGLADLASYLDDHLEFGVVFSDGYVCDEQGRILMRLADHRPAIYTGDILEPLVLDAGILTVPVCTITRRQVIEKFGIRFDPNLKYGTDWDFWIQIARHTHFGFLDKLTCSYRIHSQNITTSLGWENRRRGLLKGRLKVLQADWFGQLSSQTRYRFLHQVIIRYLKEYPDQRLELLNRPQVRDLPCHLQAALWRQSGGMLLHNKRDTEDSRLFFEEALRRFPADQKTRILLALTRHSHDLAWIVWNGWQKMNAARTWLNGVGKHRSRPMPHRFEKAES